MLYVNGVQAVCDVISNCTFEFSSDIAPIVSSVIPTNVSSPAVVTIYGSKFGNNTSLLTVTIGTQNCIVESADDETITCTLLGLSVGSQYVNVNLNGTYYCSNFFKKLLKLFQKKVLAMQFKHQV